MSNSEEKKLRFAQQKNKYSNSRVVRKKISEPNKKPYGLNGRSLIIIIASIVTCSRHDIAASKIAHLGLNQQSLTHSNVYLKQISRKENEM